MGDGHGREGAASSTPRDGDNAARDAPLDGDGQQQHASGSVPTIPGRMQAYDVAKAVGKGGYAIVYKATRKEDGKVVAVKVVEIFEMNQKKRERCLQEVTLLKQLKHPHIIQLLDAFVDDKQLVIVFEWAPAGDLRRMLKKTADTGELLEEPAIWHFFMQVVKGVLYMHQHRIMHRDIKPANVLVGANGTLKVGDLGLGRQLSEETLEAYSKVGTPYYVSPEVVKGGGYDWKSDVWSLGCLLYELAALRSPFEMEGANLYDVFQKISRCEYAPLAAEQFSGELRQLVVAMLRSNPADRPSVDEVLHTVQRVTHMQRGLSGDIYSQSEQVAEQLIVLAASIATRPAAVPTAAVPSAALRNIHALFLSDGAASSQGRNRPAQPQQLAVVLQLMVWLLTLLGQQDTARSLGSHLYTLDWGSSIPACKDAHAAAQAIKQAGLSLGVNLHYVPANQLALGYGRGVCSILHELAGRALAHVGVVCPRPEHVQPWGAGAGPRGLPDGSPSRGSSNADVWQQVAGDGGEWEEQDQCGALEPEFEDWNPVGAAGRHRHGCKGADEGADVRMQRDQGPSPDAAGTPVDPEAWRAECDRLRPQLGFITLRQAEAWADWFGRLAKCKQLHAGLCSTAGPAAAILADVNQGIQQQLDRISSLEHHCSAQSHNVDAMRGLQGLLKFLQDKLAAQEQQLQGRHALLHRVQEQHDAVQAGVQERVAGLQQPGAHVAGIQAAIRQLRQEVAGMDLRIGLLMARLLGTARRREP